MDLSVILTYRCDSRCSMCYIWKNPTHPHYEVDLETLAKLPSGFDHLNVTGGEPTLRQDLPEIVDLLRPKTHTLEISTNGLHPAVLQPIVRKHPDIKVRISVEGLGAKNDAIRGEDQGFVRKIATMERLLAAGGRDLGFATTFQDENADDILELFALSRRMGVELATAALHNAFQFHKNDNAMYDRVRVARQVEGLITDMLRTWSVKSWFRAYLNLGLIAKILGHDRLIACTAGTDFMFVDPWADVYACNVRPDLRVGNLRDQSWAEIYDGPAAKAARRQVDACTQNCWMVASAKTAMRNRHLPQIPRLRPLSWVIANKLRVSLGVPIPFDRYIDYRDVRADAAVAPRRSYLQVAEKRRLQQPVSPRYAQFKEGFFNR